ncbi:MAG: Na+/H+ antiporter NhaA, partial [Acidimicrobiales bacterium]
MRAVEFLSSCAPVNSSTNLSGLSHIMAKDLLEPSPLTWIGSDRRLARRVARPVRDFLHIEAAGGILLLVATAAALLWANSPWDDIYHEILEARVVVQFGDLLTLDLNVEEWVNDALMAIFFFVVGLEIKRELVVGELADPRAAALPAVAALGGMVVPALLYTLLNAGGPGSSGWGIPMATDIAFAVGVVSLLGSKVPSAMKVFLLTLAIVDDIGAIIVIAVFYTNDLSVGWLLIALILVGVVVAMKAVRIWYIPAYVLVGGFVWLAVFESGVHATIAGVVLGLLTPARPLRTRPPIDDGIVGEVIGPGASTAAQVRRASFEVRETISVSERLDDVLHPFTGYIIIPVFALANAGI